MIGHGFAHFGHGPGGGFVLVLIIALGFVAIVRNSAP